jgi:hypothetical protein
MFTYVDEAASVNNQTPELYMARASAALMIEWDFDEAVNN